jgi:hypothetical protein
VRRDPQRFVTVCRAIAIVLVFLTSLSEAGTLYSTQFEEFTAGDNRWSGTGGWVASNTSSGAQGITQDPVADLPLGKTGYLGYAKPSTAFTTVYRSFNHNPVTSGSSRIEFDSLLGVQDSTDTRRDRFYISFYNMNGDFLGAVVFDNTTGKVLSDDGVTVRDTGVEFLRGDQILGVAALQILRVSIDLDLNQWEASLDSVPLFKQAFTATQKPRTLGPIAVEWEIPSGAPGQAGDNWLLVADWLVASIPPGPFAVKTFARSGGGQGMLSWPSHAGFDYQVQYSGDLKTWKSDLPGSRFAAIATEGTLSFTDPTPSLPAGRYYRVLRFPTP